MAKRTYYNDPRSPPFNLLLLVHVACRLISTNRIACCPCAHFFSAADSTFPGMYVQVFPQWLGPIQLQLELVSLGKLRRRRKLPRLCQSIAFVHLHSVFRACHVLLTHMCSSLKADCLSPRLDLSSSCFFTEVHTRIRGRQKPRVGRDPRKRSAKTRVRGASSAGDISWCILGPVSSCPITEVHSE